MGLIYLELRSITDTRSDIVIFTILVPVLTATQVGANVQLTWIY
jgi:hypothetical protein